MTCGKYTSVIMLYRHTHPVQLKVLILWLDVSALHDEHTSEEKCQSTCWMTTARLHETGVDYVGNLFAVVGYKVGAMRGDASSLTLLCLWCCGCMQPEYSSDFT